MQLTVLRLIARWPDSFFSSFQEFQSQGGHKLKAMLSMGDEVTCIKSQMLNNFDTD